MIWEASSTLNTDFLHTLELSCEAQMCEGNVVQSNVRFGAAESDVLFIYAHCTHSGFIIKFQGAQKVRIEC
jgi:hypothetical protein